MRKITVIFNLFLIYNVLSFSQNDHYFSKDSLLLDIEFLSEKVHNLHPDPFKNISEDNFNIKKDSIRNIITDKETDGSFYFKISSLLSILKDGHTAVIMPKFESSRDLRTGSKIFPLEIMIIDGKIYSTYDNYRKDSIFGQMKSINDVSTDSIIGKIINSFSYDKYPDIGFNSIENNFILFYNELCGADSIYTIVYNDNTDKYTTHGLSNEQLLKLDKYSTIPEYYNIRIDNNKKSAYIKFGNFIPNDKIYNFIDSSFCLINNANIDTLVIDVRGNTGGSSDVIEKILSNLTKDKFKIYDSIQVKISNYTKDLYQKRDSLLFQQINLIKNENLFKIIPEFISTKSDIVYNGKLTILTDRRTFSGASTFANLIKTMQLGNVINDTGGNNVYFGDFAIYTLPHSKLTIAIATKKFFEWSRKSKEE